MILAGGTGGHVFPALAVATELRERGVPIVWVGTSKGLEASVVPNAGFRLEKMQIQGLRRKGLKQYLLAPFIILRALLEGLQILLKHKPGAILGMGGFVAGPCAMVGFILRKPLIIHEQNAVLGLTNRILKPLCKVMFTGFPIEKSVRKAIYVGNPVRKELLDIPLPEKRFAEKSFAVKRILIIGGSQGSAALNKHVPNACASIAQSSSIEVWHQTGEKQLSIVKEDYSSQAINARVDAFINDMQAAYLWADLVICRSGAMTLAEISMVGLGAILVPYPYAVDDHQTKNAKVFVSSGAAYLIAENELTSNNLADLLKNVLSDKKQLQAMAHAARGLGHKNAGSRVADACLQALDCGSLVNISSGR